MNAAQLQTKIAVLRSNLAGLDRIPQASLTEFESDFRNLPAALHLLQVAIQTLMDLAGYACARRGLGAPGSSQEILEKLEGAGLVPPGTHQRFTGMFAFRNRVVHLYDRIDVQRVFDILTRERRDLEELLSLVLRVLKDAPGGPP